MSPVGAGPRYRDATDALARRDFEGAREQLLLLCGRTHVSERDTKSYASGLAQAYEGLGMDRAAATAHEFVGDYGRAAQLAKSSGTDLARLFRRAGDLTRAARAYQEAGWYGHAALMLGEAGDAVGARVLWKRLAHSPRVKADPYIHGLICFNLSNACRAAGDVRAARRSMVESVHLIEAAADAFEVAGVRERAFDCYQVLLSLGKDGAFENLAEGYVNCIRILSDDALKYFVLQYYEDFQELAMARGEFLAAATLYREAAVFARRHHMTYEQAYLNKAAEAQVAAAKKAAASGLPQMAENGLAAAIDALTEIGAFARARELFGALAALDLPEKRRARYRRLQQRLDGAADAPTEATTLPSHLRMSSAYPDVWRLDVMAWEQDGDAAEVMGEVLLGQGWANFTLRRALLCRLHSLEIGATPTEAQRGELADLLGKVELYVCLDPLGRMASDPEASVRARVMGSLARLFFKASFPIIERGLEDTAPEVRRAALGAVEALHFTHALDPLRRIYRRASDPKVRSTALGSIARVQNPEAVELLLEALRSGSQEDAATARELLIRADQAEADEILRRARWAATSADEQAQLTPVLRARGLSG